MTLATKITVVRIVLVPIFAVLAVAYGVSLAADSPNETYRWLAIACFGTAALSDGLDGWIARRFDQRSNLGAFLDPIADKFLLLTAVVTLASLDWGEPGWRLPLWFAALVFLRDAMILIGIGWLYTRRIEVPIMPHRIGKWCTIAQMTAIGWVMLKWVPVSPFWPSALASLLTLVSAVLYFRQGWGILRQACNSTGGPPEC